MRILCTSDIHGDFDALKRLRESAGEYDALAIAGDLTNFFSPRIALSMVDELKSSVDNLLIVPGNCDLNDTSDLLMGLGLSLHGMGRVIDDVGFFGLGGSNITPFNTPLEFGEEEILEALERGYEEVKGCRVKILISHTPPHDTVDSTPAGVRAGSPALREFLEKKDVNLVICGHVHEARGEEKIGDTLVVNTGPAQNGFVKVVVDENGDVSCEYQKF